MPGLRNSHMKIEVSKFLIAWLFAGSCLAAADQTNSEVRFRLPYDHTGPFIHRLTIKSPGRVILDVSATPAEVEITLLLRRPDGTAASQISATGGNLSLTYSVTRQDVKGSETVKSPRWAVEVSRTAGSEEVSGRLLLSHPES